MAIACPVDLDTLKLRAEIQSIYARVATDPSGPFHFHRGPAYAAAMLGYDADALAALPAETTGSFAGVANPHRIVPIVPGAAVVDIGCGAGMDLLLAAKTVADTGRAIGVDMTEAMAERARQGARAAGLENVEVRLGDALSLPIESASVDVVISNGVLNLTPDKEEAFSEVFRILKPGGRFLYGDIIVARELSEGIRKNIDLWTGWIAGALPEAELMSLLTAIGFKAVVDKDRFDCFRGTSKENTAKKYGVVGVNVHAARAHWARGGANMAAILAVATHATDDPTKATLAFMTAVGAAGGDKPCTIALVGEGVSLAKEAIAQNVHGVGFPPLTELIAKVTQAKIPVFVWGACSVARGVTEADLKSLNASFMDPIKFAGMIAESSVVSF